MDFSGLARVRARRNRRGSPAGAAALLRRLIRADGACRKAHGARSYKRQDYATRMDPFREERMANYLEARCGIQP